MRVLVQRVRAAQVTVDKEVLGRIGLGMVLLIGCTHDDDEHCAHYCAEKCAHLRIFADTAGRMNRSLLDVGGAVLAISQFTLYGDCRRGRRPGLSAAADAVQAEPLYESFITTLESLGVSVSRGRFGAHMVVEIHNDGPVTFMVESP